MDANDETLISLFLDGDAQVIQQVRVWIRGAFRPYRSRLASELEDLEQEILIDLGQALREGRFKRQSKLGTYVRTYVHHKCIDRLRFLARRQWVDVEDLELAESRPSAFDEMARGERIALAMRVVQQMPEACRELWSMLQEGLSYRAMSERLGIAEGTLRVRVSRCRQKAFATREKLSAEQEAGSS